MFQVSSFCKLFLAACIGTARGNSEMHSCTNNIFRKQSFFFKKRVTDTDSPSSISKKKSL